MCAQTRNGSCLIPPFPEPLPLATSSLQNVHPPTVHDQTAMGLPLRPRSMNNLHAPTVPSGPTSARAATNGGSATLTFADLQRRKENLEAELKALSSVLDSVRTNVPSGGRAKEERGRASLADGRTQTARRRHEHPPHHRGWLPPVRH